MEKVNLKVNIESTSDKAAAAVSNQTGFKSILTSLSKTDILRGTVGILLTIAILIYLSRYISIDSFHSLFTETRITTLLVATMIYVTTYLARTYRFWLMFHISERSFSNTMAVVSLHTFFNHVLPFRTGELSYLYFQKRYNKIAYTTGSATLLAARLFDVLTLLIWGIIFIDGYLLKNSRFDYFIYLNVSVLFLCALFYFLYNRVTKIASPTPNGGHSMSGEIDSLPSASFLNRFVTVIKGIRAKLIETLAQVSFPHIFVSSMLIWFLTFMYFFTILLSLGSDIGFAKSLPAAFGAIIGNLLPVNGIGSIGTFEAGMALGQKAVGTSGELSVTLAFFVHGHAIAVGAILATTGWFFMKLKNGYQSQNKAKGS